MLLLTDYWPFGRKIAREYKANSSPINKPQTALFERRIDFFLFGFFLLLDFAAVATTDGNTQVMVGLIYLPDRFT